MLHTSSFLQTLPMLLVLHLAIIIRPFQAFTVSHSRTNSHRQQPNVEKRYNKKDPLAPRSSSALSYSSIASSSWLHDTLSTASSTITSSSSNIVTQATSSSFLLSATASSSTIDSNVLLGVAIGVSGLVAGIALVAFTEERGKRGNLSESMATRIAGSLMEDVEVSSVSDLGGLTSQLEKALRQSGTVQDESLTKVLEMSEEEKKKKAQEADDGW